MAQEVRKHRRAGRLRFRIMPAACLIVTMAVVSTMVQAAAESSQPTAEEYLQEIGAENAQRAALADLYKEWEDGNN